MATAALRSKYPWIKSPLILNGPMAGVAGPKLAAEVSKAGGIGFIGGGVDMKKGSQALIEARTLLSSMIKNDQDTIPVGFGVLCFGAQLEEVIELIPTHRPAIIWLFATTDDENDYGTWTRRVRESSNDPPAIWIQTSSVASAVHLAQHVKPDALVLQGSDAGGHGASPGASLISLLPETADALQDHNLDGIPLIAAGGIADFRGAAAALVLGASGICIGTRLIASVEAEPNYPIYKDIILNTDDGGYSTVRSQVFDHMGAKGSIWPKTYDGRGLRNATTKDQDDGSTIEELRGKYAEATGKQGGGFQTDVASLRANVWAGTGVGLVKTVLPAREIIESIRQGAAKILGHDQPVN